LGMCGVDLLLTDLGLEVAAKQRVVAALSHGLHREFRADHKVARQLAGQYRARRGELETVLRKARVSSGDHLVESQESSPQVASCVALLHARSRMLASACQQLQSLRSRGRVDTDLETLAMRFAHMHLNRLMRSNGPAHELVLCEFLRRLYGSELYMERIGRQGRHVIAFSDEDDSRQASPRPSHPIR
jgi:thiopeptide-type bacteriocin biosynthesis protein